MNELVFNNMTNTIFCFDDGVLSSYDFFRPDAFSGFDRKMPNATSLLVSAFTICHITLITVAHTIPRKYEVVFFGYKLLKLTTLLINYT